jgi:hypothetical protein
MLCLYLFKKINNFPYLGTIVCKFGSDFVIFLTGYFSVADFVLYLWVEFLDQVSWKVIISSY